MARHSPKAAQAERKKGWTEQEEEKAYEKAEAEDKALHKVVTAAMKKISGLKKGRK